MVTTGAELLIWNKAGNASVSFSKINVLQIEDLRHNERKLGESVVKAYLTDGAVVFMGDWATEREAKEYIENIHKEVKQIPIAGITEERLRHILGDILTGFMEALEVL